MYFHKIKMDFIFKYFFPKYYASHKKLFFFFIIWWNILRNEIKERKNILLNKYTFNNNYLHLLYYFLCTYY